MKKSSKLALPILFMMLVALFATGYADGSNMATPASAASSAAPNAWIAPVNISDSGLYDNQPSVGAAPGGGVTIAWERRAVNPTDTNWIMSANNLALDAPFSQLQIDSANYKSDGSVKVAVDALGRRHVIYWQSNGTVCGYYARIEANGLISVRETVPGTCGANRKNTALAVSADGTVHALFGHNLDNIYYYERESAGGWLPPERLPTLCGPVDISVGVTTNGVVIGAWKDCSPGGNSDIYTATRTAPGTWVREDVSLPCCVGCPQNSKAYLPSLAADHVGGMRLSWSDERCDTGRGDVPVRDIYYREWVPATGWDNSPLVRVVHGPGDAYQNSIAVDTNNVAHIIYVDFEDYSIYYVYGAGTNFSARVAPFEAWFSGSQQKDPSASADSSPGYLHVTFGSDRDDSEKEIYYSNLQVGPPPVPTPTPTLAPPPCGGGRFTDVCTTDYFYAAVLALSDQGVVSGYNTVPPCDNRLWVPCFKPYNNITRGQASKMIVLGANLPINTRGGPHFRDVPQGSAFYNYIETLYNAGIIGGYSDGTFRPGNDVTRGQLSKMDALAFGFNDTPRGQTFQDVATTNAFYKYVENLASRDLISGYPCGGPGEPCVPPANKPYFRPNNDVTRGQASKIIYLSQSASAATATTTTTAVSTSTVVATVTPTSVLTDTPTVELTGTPPTETSTVISTATSTSTVAATDTPVP